MENLLEQLLISEFTFGYELEAHVDKNTVNFDEEDKSELFKNLEDFFKKEFNQNDLTVGDDLSLDKNGFELQSPVFNLTPLNIQKNIDFLSNLENTPYKIYTNDKCGFHTHVSFPQLEPNDIYWIECNLALDNNMRKNLSSILDTDGVKINFVNEKYADDSYLDDLKEAIENDDFKSISDLMSEEKRRLLRNHPQGTLEWRGPRNFLNKKDIKLIKNFFIKLYNFCKWISNTLKKDSINEYDKKTFLNLINEFNPSYNDSFKKDSRMNKILDKILLNPMILLKANFNLYDSIDVINQIHNKLGEKFNSFIDKFANKKLPEKILTGILMVEPKFYQYSIQHQPLPINEIYKINPSYITDILYVNLKKISKNDIYDIISSSSKILPLNQLLLILRDLSIKSHINFFDKKLLGKIALEYNLDYDEVLINSIEYTPNFQ